MNFSNVNKNKSDIHDIVIKLLNLLLHRSYLSLIILIPFNDRTITFTECVKE